MTEVVTCFNNGKKKMPACVLFKNQKVHFVGSQAQNRQRTSIRHMKNLLYDSKLILGKRFSELQALRDKWQFILEHDDDDNPLYQVTMNDDSDTVKHFYAKEIASIILKEVRNNAIIQTED